MNLKQFLFWFPMIVIAIANAGIRELVLDKYLNELNAHQISTITLIAFCAVYIGLISPSLGLKSHKEALILGFIWVLLTVGFEFIFGRFMGTAWQVLFNDYNLLTGRLWSVFLLGLFILPYIFHAFRK